MAREVLGELQMALSKRTQDRVLRIWLLIRCTKLVVITFHCLPKHVDLDCEYGTATQVHVKARLRIFSPSH